MRRQFLIVALALLFVGGVALSADEAVLMDFNLLKADLPDAQNQGKVKENKLTMMDFSDTAGASYTDVQKQQMRTSLAMPNWDVVLASSSKTLLNQSLSRAVETSVSADSKQKDVAGKTVMGVRIHFPTEPFNSWALVQPPFEIPAFELNKVDDSGNIVSQDPGYAGSSRFEGTKTANVITAVGIVKNVGILKTVAVTVKGLNFPHGLSIVLKDANGDEKVLFMGYLNFDGWKELRWENPQYVNDVRNRELKIYPLYPASVPFVKFGGFLLSRDASSTGGDFVAYFKDVKILYDKAVLDPLGDINDEAVWGIILQRERDRKDMESRAFGGKQVERFLERQKQTGPFEADKATK